MIINGTWRQAQEAMDIPKALKKVIKDLPGRIKALIEDTAEIPAKVFRKVADETDGVL